MNIKIGITATDFAGNKGAAAMLQSIVKNIKKENHNTDFSLFSVYPAEDKQQNPYDYLKVVPTKPERIIFIAFPLAILYKLIGWIKPFKKLLLKNKILAGFNACDFIVDAAGISFVDSRGFVMNTYNFICMATPLLLGKKVIKLSQAMGPCRSFFNKLWAKIALSKLDKVCSRGQYTHQHLLDLGLKNVELCADIAFLMPDDDEQKSKVDKLVEGDDFYSKKIVSLSISSVVYKYCEKSGIDYYKTMTDFVSYLNSKGYGVLMIANAARAGKEKLKNNDLPIGDKLYSMIEKKDGVRWYSEEFTPEMIRELISKSEILVASRFHAMIGALEKCVPVLLVGWSHKYKEVLDMFELGEYAVDYKKLNYDDLTSMFEKVETNRESIAGKIESNLPKVKQSSYKNFEIVFSKIDSVSKAKQKYMGYVENSYACYASNKDVRADAASGGVVSQTLIYMLENKHIDGALVSKQYVENDEIKVKSFIATSKDEILDCRTSIYTNFNLFKAFKQIEGFDGQIAVVCLPCHLERLDKLSKTENYIGKIKYKLCLFCGGVAEPRLMERVLEKNNIDIHNVERIHSRKGHWRGNTMIEMSDHSVQSISYKYNWSTYKNAFYYSSPKCFACMDHFGYNSDFSFGDIWLSEMKAKDIKHTAILARNADADGIIKDMLNENVIIGGNFSAEKIQKGNKRAVIYKYNTAEARTRIGKRYGMNGPKIVLDQSKWNHVLVSKIIIRNMRRSKDEGKMDKTFKKNQKLMFVYMAFIRVLLSF